MLGGMEVDEDDGSGKLLVEVSIDINLTIGEFDGGGEAVMNHGFG